MTMKCLVCDSNDVQPKAKRGHIAIFSCSRCKMVFATGEKLRTHTETVVDTDPDFYAATMKNYNQQSEKAGVIVAKRLKAYEKMLGRPVSSILEIGCGTGAYANAYVGQKIKYQAIELDPQIAEFARERSGAQIDVGNFLIDPIEHRFDVVFASQVFEHITTPHDFLQKAKTTLCENGILHLDVPNHASLSSSIRKFVGKVDYGFIQPPHHMLAYTPTSFNYVLENNGFTDISINQYRNDEATWGQLTTSPSLSERLQYFLSGLIGRGSLLSALARS